MSDRDLEKEYSPSQWTKRFATGDEVFQNHLEVVQKGKEQFKQ